MKNVITLIFLLIIFSKSFSQPFDPVNKNASPEAKQLLKYLYSINGNHILSGEHNFNENMNRFNDSVKSITGKYPALWGTDFIWNWKTDNGQAIVDESIKKNKEGFIISINVAPGQTQ